VDIASSSFPHWDANPNTGAALGTVSRSEVETATQTVFHDGARPSHIVLPVVAR
jgi:predicted acyl esterase